MEYSKLISVTGLPGLYELVSSKTDGAIVRSLEDGSSRFAATRQHQFSHLESIEVYTVRENVNLAEVFNAMLASGVPLPAEKDAKAVKSYFEKVYPDLDFDRVYNSDMKKMVRWLSIISDKGIEIRLTEEADAETPAAATTPEPAETAVPEEKAPKKKAKKKEEGA
ncbi:MAG TPA: DUF5606 domain-containing protein [Lacibacter sp.]|nr:DUF5606 domain-containing protein [Lacibacter sp.]HMO88306.1 DUF5606 domain-containing protein [Lacibacter sp.]HMP86582.1 DUF5606 domain-containing protein [Lacibacter sp.]